MIRKALIVPPGMGRVYPAGRMQAIFKADMDETASKYSVSEWWLDPGARLPNQHSHGEDHIFYVIEGILSVVIDDEHSDAPSGTYILIPGDTPHSFENQQSIRSGFISFNVPGGFEKSVPAIASALASE